MGVQGFPTLKIVRPKKGGGKPMVQDYQGQRTASAMVDAVVQQINNYVVKVEDKSLDKFLSDKKESPKAILFTDKGTTSALLKSIAIDFADVITIGQARNKETKVVEAYAVEKFPTLVLLPGGDAPAIVYDGELKKEAMVKFLSQAGAPNPDPPVKAKSEKNGKKDSKASNKKSSSSKAQSKASSETSSATPESETETSTQEAPVIVETALPIPAINSPEKLIKECLTEKSHTCVLAFVSSSEDEAAKKALTSLSELAFKHAQSKRHLFPFYEVPKSNEGATSLLKALDLSADVEIIAINARRGWWRHYEGADFGHESVEAWIDAIRMSEGVKKKLPEGIVAISVEEAAAPAVSSAPTPEATEAGSSEEATPVTPEASGEPASDSTESTSTKGADPTGEPETAAEHDEL
jgi:protein disulfide-isomerase A6